MQFRNKRKQRKVKKQTKLVRLAKPKETNINTLARAVRKLQIKERKITPYINYFQTVSTGITADYLQIKLSNYINWNRVFGTDANDDTGNMMKHNAIGIDTYISLENTVNEPDTTTFTCFLVSLKDEIGGAMSQVSGDLTLAPNVHYTINGGLVMLNKKCFNIHKIKRFVLTNHGSALSNPSAQSQYGTDKRFYWKIKPNKLVKCAYGDWKTFQCAQDYSDNLYVLIFNDNSAIDLQNPLCKMNIVHTVQSYN